MDISACCNFSVSEDVNSATDSIESFSNCDQFLRETSTIDSNTVTDLGNALGQVLHVQDVEELVSDPTLATHEATNTCEDKEKSCQELEVHQVTPSSITTHKALSKFATFPCYNKSMNDTLLVGQDDISTAATNGQCSRSSETRVCTRSMSLPTCSELLSALKGSRGKQGTPLTKLTVKWAPEVYDPPSTSLSHTVKGHSQQRLRTSKRNGKHKHKGKSSRGSNSDKKHYSNSEKRQFRNYYSGQSERRSKSFATNEILNSEQDSKSPPTSAILNSDLYSKSPRADDTKSELHVNSPVSFKKLLQSDFRPSTRVDLVMDFVSAQESKCGSSFLRSSLSKVHISVAEAT